jgi:hypothetical protein
LFTGFKTEEKRQFHFRPLHAATRVNFKVKAPKDVRVALPTGPTEKSAMYEVRFIIVFFLVT